MEDEARNAKEKVSDGIKQGIGVLSALKDALEETIEEAKDRGDLSTERAKELVKEALHKAQAAAGGAKERLDFVTQREFDGLREAVDTIGRKVTELEARIRGDDPPSAGGDAEEADPGS